MSEYKYKRIVLKLSGEALAGKDGHGYDAELISDIAKEIKGLTDDGIQIVIIVGGGNIIRGGTASNNGQMNRSNADYMGMLATVINAMALQEGFRSNGLRARAMSAVEMERVCDTYYVRRAEECLNNGEIIICGGGTINPFFTTDTNASLRACELNCDCVLKATKVDGVYDSDPVKNPEAKKFDNISYNEVLAKGLRVMDLTSISMCMDNNIPVIVFNMSTSGNIKKALQGKNVGTLVS